MSPNRSIAPQKLELTQLTPDSVAIGLRPLTLAVVHVDPSYVVSYSPPTPMQKFVLGHDTELNSVLVPTDARCPQLEPFQISPERLTSIVAQDIFELQETDNILVPM